MGGNEEDEKYKYGRGRRMKERCRESVWLKLIIRRPESTVLEVSALELELEDSYEGPQSADGYGDKVTLDTRSSSG